MLIAQQSLFDSTRAPEGKQTLWAYCHVPHGSEEDMTERVEAQIERFAPGFRDLILARSTRTAMGMNRYNPNYIGGDINGGVQDLRQLWTRPLLRWPPYATPLKGVYLCSSSTPPGGGVHGMCGFHAARVALGMRCADVDHDICVVIYAVGCCDINVAVQMSCYNGRPSSPNSVTRSNPITLFNRGLGLVGKHGGIVALSWVGSS